MFGKDRQGGDVQGQRAAFVVLEVEAHGALVLDHDVLDRRELGAIAQAALGHQQLEAVAHILGGDGLAIGEAGLGVQVEAQGQAIVGTLHLLRHQAINGIGLVQRALGQRRIQHPVDLADADAFVDVGQDVVEWPISMAERRMVPPLGAWGLA